MFCQTILGMACASVRHDVIFFKAVMMIKCLSFRGKKAIIFTTAGLTLDTIFSIETLPQILVQIGRLIVDGVIVGIESLALLQGYFSQKVSDFDSVLGMEYVPQCSRQLIPLPYPEFHGNVTACEQTENTNLWLAFKKISSNANSLGCKR